MTPGAIDPAVEQFLLDSIDTVPHLEALLLLFQSPTTVWTVVQLAAERADLGPDFRRWLQEFVDGQRWDGR